MSNIDMSNINKESIKHKSEDKEKEKDKEKETSNLLDDNQIQKRNQDRPFINLEKDNELFCFMLLTAFIFVIYILTRLKHDPRTVNQIMGEKIIENSFYHEIESTDLINSFENRYRNIYPEITLELINEFPTLEQIFSHRILYIKDRNLTVKYIKHVRPIEDKEEEQFRPPLYKDLVPKDNFSETRENFINTEKFIDICNKEQLINKEKITPSDKPLISIILQAYNKRNEITRSVRSIQNQSLKNIEIIIVDDFSSENATDVYNNLLDNDKRIRVFYHMKNSGVFKSRLDGFLYSNGQYILFVEPGDLLSDNYVLEDMYKLITKYNLDSVRFAFKIYKTIENNKYQISTHIYPEEDLKITYGKVLNDVQIFGYGSIWNRLIRANVITKGLDLIDQYILNAYKNLWEDLWWNNLVNEVSFSHLVVNRVGYIYYSPDEGQGKINISSEEEREKTIKEFIYSWLCTYQLTRAERKKKDTIATLKKFNSPENKYYGTPVSLDYLRTNFTAYVHLLDVLINDYFVEDSDKKYLNQLFSNFTEKIVNINYLNSLNNTLNNTLNNGL